MSVETIIQLREERGAQQIVRAVESYKARLSSSIARTRRRLAGLERRHGVSTTHFLREMTADDLDGGDLEYVEQAGEARLLEGLEAELTELEHARCQLP